MARADHNNAEDRDPLNRAAHVPAHEGSTARGKESDIYYGVMPIDCNGPPVGRRGSAVDYEPYRGSTWTKCVTIIPGRKREIDYAVLLIPAAARILEAGLVRRRTARRLNFGYTLIVVLVRDGNTPWSKVSITQGSIVWTNRGLVE